MENNPQSANRNPQSDSPAWKIVLSDVDFGPEEEAAALRVIRSKWLTMGAETRAFEEEFACAIGVPHAVAVANGTDGLLISLLALGVGPGDEVVQPAVNFVAAANMTILAGARPVFCGIRALDDPTLAPAALESCITPATRAVVVMHYGGAACRMDDILAICRPRGIAVIEDACHGVGGSYRGVKMGALGDAAAFSFFSNKNMVTGEGGMVTTGRAEIAEALRALRSHGMTTLTWDRHRGHASSYDVVRHGLNTRMDELRAAIGRAQLAKLPRNNERRRALAREYHRLIHGEFSVLLERGWVVPLLGVDGDEASHHLMAVVAPDEEARGRAMGGLRESKIQSSIHYPFIPEFTAFEKSERCRVGNPLDTSREFCHRVLTLPLHPLLTKEDLRSVLAALIG